MRVIVGWLLGLAGLLLPVALDLPGLEMPGEIALGIFCMAAVFWVLEPVPIWATSMLVIFLQVGLLSDVSPLANRQAQIPTTQVHIEPEGVWVSPAVLGEGEQAVWVQADEGPAFVLRPVQVIQRNGDRWLLDGGAFAAGDRIATSGKDWRLSFSPPSYTRYYGNLASPIIILFLGGFCLAAAAVKHGLDKNLTRIVLNLFGKKSSNVVLGILLCTAMLSAFMSNTATAAMMLTVVLPIAGRLDSTDPLRTSILLAIPCAANIGGILTPISTPPNAIVVGALAQQGIQIGFLQWVAMMLPLSVLLLFIAWRGLMYLFPPKSNTLSLDIEAQWERSMPAYATYFIFGLTVLLWFSDQLHGLPADVVAFIPIAFLPLFGVLNKSDIRGFSWDVLWLMAGGLSLGITMQMGPAEWLVGLVDWSVMTPVMITIVVAVFTYCFGNLVSNTVAASILVPIAVLIGVTGAAGEGYDLVITSLVVGIVVSFAMLLPVSTPPNALVMSTGHLTNSQLLRAGLVVGVSGILCTLVLGVMYWSLLIRS